MKKKYITIVSFIVFLLLNTFGWCQVGIETTSPSGALDIASTTRGVVYPVVSLTNIYNETVTNPNAVNLIAGTTVYNTNTTNDGDGSVYPGLYMWNGTEWVPQFEKKDNKLYSQDSSLRTGSDDLINGILGDQTISFDGNSFTPKFNGKYKILLTVHYGGGNVDSPSNPQYVNFVSEEGQFNFSFGVNTTSFNLKSFSGKNNDKLFKGGSGSPEKVYSNQFNQASYIFEYDLIAGTNYAFSLTFNQANAAGFEGNGDISIIPTGDGRGYINIDNSVKCTVEINYTGN